MLDIEPLAPSEGSSSASVWRTDEWANHYGAIGFSLFCVVAALASWLTGQQTGPVVAVAAVWVGAGVALWVALLRSSAGMMLIWPVVLSLCILSLTVVSPMTAALLVGAQTLGFVFAGQTNPPGWFVILLPAAWTSAWFAYDLPLRETLIRLSIATIIWAVCAEIPARLLVRLRHMASIDPLTGLSTRATMNQTIAQIARRTATGAPSPALVLIDLDHFKAYNDAHGHLGGDNLLRAFGQCIKSNCRREDLTYRFGGEEFLLVFDQVSLDQAAVLVERMRTAWSHHPSGTTFSAGIATTINRADQCLYEAKDAGRDTTRTARARRPV